MIQTADLTGLVGCVRVDAQRMNIGCHQITERRINKTMALDQRTTRESAGYHRNMKMTESRLRAGMASAYSMAIGTIFIFITV